LRLHHEAQRAFGAAQHAVEVEAPVAFAQMGQVIAGEAAVELGESGLDQLRLILADAPRRAVHLADAARIGAHALQRLGIQRRAVQALAAQQHEVQRQHVVARLAIGAAALPAGIGVDHAADGGAVGGGQLGGKEQPVWLERSVELVLDHAGLHAHPALLGIDFEDAVHVPRQVHGHAMRERLTVRARAAAARCQHHIAELRPRQHLRRPGHILGVTRVDGRLRHALVDGVVRGQHGATGMVRVHVALEAGGLQRFKKLKVLGRHGGAGVGQWGNRHGRQGGEICCRRSAQETHACNTRFQADHGRKYLYTLPLEQTKIAAANTA